MKEVDCGQMRLTIAMLTLGAIGLAGLVFVIAVVIVDLLGDSQL